MKPRFGDKRRKPARSKLRINIDREFLNKAIEEYLKSGGKITGVELMPNIDDLRHSRDAVDDFLKGSDLFY